MDEKIYTVVVPMKRFEELIRRETELGVVKSILATNTYPQDEIRAMFNIPNPRD